MKDQRRHEVHTEYAPSFGVTKFQSPMCILTVLSVGYTGRDCAAYRGIVPAPTSTDLVAWDHLITDVKKGGDKISKAKAERLFDIGDLLYRE